jgi:hypothetical protein
LQQKAAETLQLMQSSYAVAASSASHGGNKFLQKYKVKGKTSGKEKHIFMKVSMVAIAVHVQIRV